MQAPGVGHCYRHGIWFQGPRCPMCEQEDEKLRYRSLQEQRVADAARHLKDGDKTSGPDPEKSAAPSNPAPNKWGCHDPLCSYTYSSSPCPKPCPPGRIHQGEYSVPVEQEKRWHYDESTGKVSELPPVDEDQQLALLGFKREVFGYIMGSYDAIVPPEWMKVMATELCEALIQSGAITFQSDRDPDSNPWLGPQRYIHRAKITVLRRIPKP